MSERNALVGHTGFIGSNIHRSRSFDDVFNTSNIDDIRGREYDLVVCAAGRADGHRINDEPDVDLAELELLAERLGDASIGRLVHISTVCVYGPGDDCDERVDPDPEALAPYGRNRLWLERELAERFDTLRVRLPQLFGSGIKKGLVFDLATGHRIEHIRPDDRFQYYDLGRLWSDIEVALDASLDVVNMATEPVRHRDLAREVFGIELGDGPSDPPSPHSVMYTRDMTTVHGEVYDREGKYLMTSDEEMRAIAEFVDGPHGPLARGGAA